MKRRILILFFAVILICSSILTVSARNVSLEESYAVKLKELGLFYGVGENDFDLERAPTRIEALVMLIRVLGEESTALSGTWKHPFTDIPNWADKYVGYAYEHKLANGMSLTEFGTSNATSAQYLTFMLRALGFSDTNGLDFTWDKPYDLARHVGILPSSVDLENFWRADVATISYTALSAKLKNSNQALYEKLVSAGTFTKEKYNEVILAKPEDTNITLTPVEISEKCANSVFYIEVYAYNGRLMGSGSGFFISSDGYAITNHHVAANARYMCITMPDGTKYDKISVIDSNATQDLALLKVDSENKFSYLELGDSTVLKQGQKVYAIGSPLGLENTMSQGIISNTKRMIGETHYIQISVPIDNGSSGGALIDEQGKVVGVTSAGFSDSGSDLNLIIPIQYVDTLDRSSEPGYDIWNENYFPGMSYIYNFYTFSGMQALNYNFSDYGYSLVYNGSDVHEVKDIEGNILYTADDSYNFCITQYGLALEKNGLKHTKVDGHTDVYENDIESIKIVKSTKSDKNITFYVNLKPQYYPEAEGLIDLGWYMGLKASASESDGKKATYSYDWSETSVTWEYMHNVLAGYITEVASPRYTCFDDEFDKSGNFLAVITDHKTIIELTLTDTHVNVSIEPFRADVIAKNFEILAGYIKKNCTSSANGKYTYSAKDGEDTYIVSYANDLISFAGRVVLPDSEIQLYVRLDRYGAGKIEATITKGRTTSKLTSTLYPKTFSKNTVLISSSYSGQNLNQDKTTVVSAAVLILKKCDTLILEKSSIGLTELGFTQIYKN